ncbi:hypothetical protein [Clostridium thermarum]|nr:hypothetical protein [Clostridium thermarum]
MKIKPYRSLDNNKFCIQGTKAMEPLLKYPVSSIENNDSYTLNME